MGIAKRVEKIASEQKLAKKRMAKTEGQGRLAATIRRAVRYLLPILWLIL